MKIISAAIVLALALFCNAEPVEMYCRVFTKNCVLCSSEKIPGQMQLYWIKKDGSWVRKLHLFGDENYQSVYVRTYKRYDYYEMCVNLELFEILQHKPEYTDAELSAVKNRCRAFCDSVLSDVKSGNKIEIPNFDMGFNSDYEEPFSMHCGFFSYVETRRYNKKGVVTRKKSYELVPGDYCRKFLANDKVYWEP